MRNHFDNQLEQLNIELIKMGALCEDAIASAIKALLDNDIEMVKKANDAERQIDRQEREIESICMKLLLQQQPVARDLRLISSALKMISDMERIGDQASDIAEIASFVHGDVSTSGVHIKDMAIKATEMVTESINSFVQKNIELAISVEKSDDVVDDLFTKVRGEIIEQIKSNRNNGEFYLDLLMIAKYLERIGDHAVNISEWVVYSITGSRDTEEQEA